MRKIFILLLFFTCQTGSQAQALPQLSLEEAYTLAREHYPLLKNEPLLSRQTDLKVQNLSRSRLPSIQWKADATLQSETVQFPGDGMVPIQIDLPLYNLKTYAEAQYTIYDGGINEALQDLERLQLAVSRQSLEVDLYPLYNQVNRYFFNVLLLREQRELLNVTLDDLNAREATLQAGVRHGVVLESEVDKVVVKQLEIRAEQEQMEQDALAWLSVLASLTGTTLSDSVELVLPGMEDFQWSESLDRPEQQLFQLQKEALRGREALIGSTRKPRLGAFLRAGMGYPNPLNFFDNSLSPYAMGGLSFSWDLFDWGKADRDRQLLVVQSQLIDHQEEAFAFNLDQMKDKYRKDAEKLLQQIRRDQEIADLQHKILLQLGSQLENGVLTVTEYIIQVNAELQARQKLRLHEIQLHQVMIDYQTQRGQLH